MPLDANSVTNTPPPAAANGSPYDAPGVVTVQPSLLFTRVEQSVVLTSLLVCTEEFDWIQPCNISVSDRPRKTTTGSYGSSV